MRDHISHISSFLAAASERVLILSAYVGRAAVAELLGASTTAAERALYARWEVDDIASGASDWQVWDVAKECNVPFFACPRLHAKIYVADDRALVGSANATAAGLGLAANPNLELLVEVHARHASIADVLRIADETSVSARPIGPDAASSPSHDDPSQSQHVPIWLPKSDPALFLKAMTGRTGHDDLTRQDRETIHLPPAESSRHAIRAALRDLTAFRLVRDEFQTRMTPMALSELRALLATSVGSGLSLLQQDELALLARWLGEFGANTVCTPSLPGQEIQLVPGTLLGSEEEFDE